MPETNIENPELEEIEDIRDLWTQTQESRRVDPVEPQFEIGFFFQMAVSDMELRLASLKSHTADATRFDAEMKEIRTELELCKRIGGLLLGSQNKTRPI